MVNITTQIDPLSCCFLSFTDIMSN